MAHLRFREDNLPISAISYEDLIVNRKYACEQIFRYCNLPLEDVPLALKAMDNDSQLNSVISRKLVQRIPMPELPKKLQVDADVMCDKYGLPRVPGPCILEGTITHRIWPTNDDVICSCPQLKLLMQFPVLIDKKYVIILT